MKAVAGNTIGGTVAGAGTSSRATLDRRPDRAGTGTTRQPGRGQLHRHSNASGTAALGDLQRRDIADGRATRRRHGRGAGNVISGTYSTASSSSSATPRATWSRATSSAPTPPARPPSPTAMRRRGERSPGQHDRRDRRRRRQRHLGQHSGDGVDIGGTDLHGQPGRGQPDRHRHHRDRRAGERQRRPIVTAAHGQHDRRHGPPVAGNLISGNRQCRRRRDRSPARHTGNLVEGNLIGTDVRRHGRWATSIGVEIIAGAADNTIGGRHRLPVPAPATSSRATATRRVHRERRHDGQRRRGQPDRHRRDRQRPRRAPSVEGIYVGAPSNTIGGTTAAARQRHLRHTAQRRRGSRPAAPATSSRATSSAPTSPAPHALGQLR